MAPEVPVEQLALEPEAVVVDEGLAVVAGVERRLRPADGAERGLRHQGERVLWDWLTHPSAPNSDG